MRIRTLIILILLLVAKVCTAQDHLYSQFYNAPNYLNPALNGQFEADLRFSLIYRNQWTLLDGNLKYYNFSVDYKLPELNSGIGIMVTSGSEGVAYLKKTNVSAIYSYIVALENGALSFGVQAGMTSFGVDSKKLIFSDQIDDVTGIMPGSATDAAIAQGGNKLFFDTGAGINLVLGNFMTGISAQHLNRPDQSLINSSSTLAIRSNAYISYKIDMDKNDEKENAMIPSIVAFNQSNQRIINGGLQYKYRALNFGAWYRRQEKNNNAFVFSVMFDLFRAKPSDNKLRLGLSHETGVAYKKTGGSSEGAINYELFVPYRNTSQMNSPAYRCYKFY